MNAWYASCTSPGAEQERLRMDEAGVEFRDFGELREEARRISDAHTGGLSEGELVPLVTGNGLTGTAEA